MRCLASCKYELLNFVHYSCLISLVLPINPREVIQPEVMEEMVVSCVIKHLNLVDALQSLINFQYQEEHAEEYDLLCKIMGETFKKLNAMERQLQVKIKLHK